MKRALLFFGLMTICHGALQTAKAHATWIESKAKAIRNKRRLANHLIFMIATPVSDTICGL